MSLYDQRSLSSQRTSISQNHGFWNELYNATVGSLFELSTVVTARAGALRKNFWDDFTNYRNYLYPIRGFCEFLKWPRYWGFGLIVGFCYALLFIMLTALYFTFLLPILSAWQVVLLGPIGMVISIIQMVLQCNMWTVRGVKWFVLPVIKEDLFDTYLRRKGYGRLLNTLKQRSFPVVPTYRKNHLEFWIYQIPLQVFLFVCSVTLTIFIIALSMVPIIGPTFATILLSPRRSFNYYNTWMNQLRMTRQMKCDSYYEKLGQHMAFGLSCGFFELFPVLSIIGICSNVISTALVVEDEIDQRRIALDSAELASIATTSTTESSSQTSQTTGTSSTSSS
ncbi:ADL027Wp [Eremothecium gossypii ATCC 10895]|uniref:ADL027Wp n=1 Tax=Eremothecium gossypii (strain ATCC 10895 / CBS 109.51 / FGSC 9923 / NRRL Y-1056) TaxID=284811 RepID=Q75AE4_EREGS|nr:ADL027Wp [Eremothecium gossypii ATCC 10895]AAS51894.1 ADL027Wp [Eremothecium gossypii ATCC 10895]AEY96193.1 FADL027Wp [Eremothecium gossypii FDAG1]